MADRQSKTLLAKHSRIRFTVELAESAVAVDINAIADAFALDLQSDTVTRWSNQVQEAIDCAKRSSNPLRPAQDDPDSKKRTEVRAQIAALQGLLKEMERK